MANMTMGDVNGVLKEIGLPPMEKQIYEAVLGVESKDNVLHAVKEARNNPNAVQFLKKLYVKSGVLDNNGQPTEAFSHLKQAQPSSETSARPVASAGGGTAPVSSGGSATGASAPNRGSVTPMSGSISTPAGESHSQPPSAGGNSGEGRSDSSTTPIDRLSFHVYGGKGALCFEADSKRTGEATIAIDAAKSSAPRQYDWSDKVRIQVTQTELPVVAAVFAGILPSCEYSQHGPNKDKGFSIERQDKGKIYVKVMAKDKGVRGVPVEGPDVFRVASLLVRQIHKNHPWLDASSVMTLLKTSMKDVPPPASGNR